MYIPALWRRGHSTSIIATIQVADTIASLIVPYFFLADPDRRVAQYSPRYRLAFSLLNEDASAGDGVLIWDIQRGLKCQYSIFFDSVTNIDLPCSAY